MQLKRRREDKVDIKTLERQLTGAEDALRQAERHNDVLIGKLTSANEQLEKWGFQDSKDALKQAEKLERSATRKESQLIEDIKDFQVKFKNYTRAIEGE